jgi:addiction module HigA family antidote
MGDNPGPRRFIERHDAGVLRHAAIGKIGRRMKNPVHPGGFIKHEIIAPLALTVTAAAKALGVTRAALSTVLNERASLSPEMALRVEKAFGVSMDTLMRMQNSYDIAKTRKHEGTIKAVRFVACTTAGKDHVARP